MKLSHFLNDAFHQYGQNRGSLNVWRDIDDFLYNEDRCFRLLHHFLDLDRSEQSIKELNFISFYRCQHIFVTFLLGLGLIKKFNMLKGVNVINGMPDEYLWMLTSVVHDYGYLKKGLTEMPDLADVDDKYHLLSDGCAFSQLASTADYSAKYSQYLTYTYDTIRNYYAYKSDRLEKARWAGYYNKDGETVDHGIYGACQCYKEYCDFYIKHEFPKFCISPDDKKEDIDVWGYDYYRINERPEIVKLARTEPVLYKTACLIAAQHNIFRSSNIGSDKIYSEYGLDSLQSTTPIAVTKGNPLLYLLSIVDTIECTKCFENLYLNEDDKKNHRHEFGLSFKDVLDNVEIDTDGSGFIIDYTGLETVIGKYWSLCHRKDKRAIMFEALAKQIRNVADLPSWIVCKTEMKGKMAIRIEF